MDIETTQMVYHVTLFVFDFVYITWPCLYNVILCVYYVVFVCITWPCLYCDFVCITWSCVVSRDLVCITWSCLYHVTLLVSCYAILFVSCDIVCIHDLVCITRLCLYNGPYLYHVALFVLCDFVCITWPCFRKGKQRHALHPPGRTTNAKQG